MGQAMLRISDSPAALRAAERNVQTCRLQTYGSHRQHTMSLLRAAADKLSGNAQSIAVLGAGNCLDLDVRELTTRFRTIQLLDLDRNALEHGVAAQASVELSTTNNPPASEINFIAPIDLAAPLAELEPGDLAGEGNADTVCGLLRSPFRTTPCAPADIVVSTCVLSQMIEALANTAGERHPHFLQLLQSVRRGHLCRMLQLLRPGGRGLFISDLVSSESAPELSQVTAADLPGLLAECLSAGNFFSGLNPGVILQDLNTCPEIAPRCQDVEIHPPWLWQMGPRTYAVYAITFMKCVVEGPHGIQKNAGAPI